MQQWKFILDIFSHVLNDISKEDRYKIIGELVDQYIIKEVFKGEKDGS